MILTCPSCGTQYVVKDGAIPPGGRQVRCASCKHSWHQDPPEVAQTEPPRAAPMGVSEPPREEEIPASNAQESSGERVADQESFAETTLIEPRSGPEAEERAFEEAAIEDPDAAPPDLPGNAYSQSGQYGSSDGFDIVTPSSRGSDSDWREPPQAEAQVDDFVPYPAPDETAPRRRSPVLMILLIVVLIVVAAAAFWFLASPDLKARLGIAGATTSPLALVTTHMDRQRLESGNELLTVTGRVINPTAQEQDVPPLQAQLKTRAGRIVYSWTIAPPARSLAPGASASFNSAEVNVPPGGDELTITLGAEAG